MTRVNNGVICGLRWHGYWSPCRDKERYMVEYESCLARQHWYLRGIDGVGVSHSTTLYQRHASEWRHERDGQAARHTLHGHEPAARFCLTRPLRLSSLPLSLSRRNGILSAEEDGASTLIIIAAPVCLSSAADATRALFVTPVCH